MRIIVRPRKWIEENINWLKNEQVISIFSSTAVFAKADSPFKENRKNILKLQFDDIECEMPDIPGMILFNESHARMIKNFVRTLDTSKKLFVHCHQGIARSGAVGYVLNDYFNKFLEDNVEDHNWFKIKNMQVLPNNVVKNILFKELFKLD